MFLAIFENGYSTKDKLYNIKIAIIVGIKLNELSVNNDGCFNFVTHIRLNDHIKNISITQIIPIITYNIQRNII